MRAINGIGAHADPRQMRRQVEPAFTTRNLPSERGFVVEQQQLMAGVKIHALHLRDGCARERLHETQAFADGIDHFLILGRQR